MGALGDDNHEGAAYVFVRTGEVWTQEAKFITDDATEGDNFGYSVSINGKTTLIGSSGKDGYAGSAYVNTLLPEITIIDREVDEGVGTVVFTVDLTPSSGRQVTVQFNTCDGSAIAGQDHYDNSGTLTFNHGEVSKEITVSIIDDSVDEGQEDFFIDLHSATNAVISDSVGRCAINDNDPP